MAEGALARRLVRLWYDSSAAVWPLLPVSLLFCTLVILRRWLYSIGWRRSERLPVPVVVVGNITVGGTGKTPLVVWLAKRLAAAGWRPGIVSRGYGGASATWPRRVAPDSDPREVGDEPVLIAAATDCPVAVGPDRPAAARLLLEDGVDVIVSDDGLQHYRLGRDLELAVLDGERMTGNGHCLPAGPLREPASRLGSVDFVVVNGTGRAEGTPMELVPGRVRRVAEPAQQRELGEFGGRRVHAVAGIGHPQRFFAMLRRAGLEPIEHPFPDHHAFAPRDLDFDDGLPVLMTEKDAVKCRPFAGTEVWSVAVEARLPDEFERSLLEKLKKR